MQNNIQSTTCQSIPLDWLQIPSEKDRASLVEFARGTLCSLSMREDGNFAPVHVSRIQRSFKKIGAAGLYKGGLRLIQLLRSEEHTSELQSLMRISYAVFCLNKKT